MNNESLNHESCIIKVDTKESENMIKYFQESEFDEEESELHKRI